MLTTATSLSDSSGDKLMEKIKNVYSIVTDENNDMRTRALALRSVVERCVYDKENDELKILFYTLDCFITLLCYNSVINYKKLY